MKRLIAFSSVAHMGFVMLGIATLTDFGINAAIFGMVAHGLITGMLFFVAGSVKERYHTLEIKRARRPAPAGAAAWAGSSASAPWRRSACPAWPGSGASSRPSSSAYNPAAASTSALFRVLHGGRRDRHRARRRLPAVAVPAHRVRHARPRSSPTTAHPRRAASPSGSPGCRCSCCILVLGFFPNLIFHVTDPAVHARCARPSPALGGEPTVLASLAAAGRRSTAPTIDFHALAPEIVARRRHRAWCSSSTSSRSTSAARASCRRSPASACWPPLIPVLTLAVDGADRVDVRRRLRGRQLRAGAQGAVPARRATSSCCCRPTTSPRATTGRASTTSCMLCVGARHDGHGVGPRPHQRSSSPSSCCRSRPTCSPAGASATCKGNEAGLKYYLMGVFASAVMLYGMSLLYGFTGTHAADRDRAETIGDLGELDARSSPSASCSWSSASPSRSRPCRSTPGRPTPTRARPRRSPRSWPWRRRRPASSPCCSSIFVGFCGRARRRASR